MTTRGVPTRASTLSFAARMRVTVLVRMVVIMSAMGMAIMVMIVVVFVITVFMFHARSLRLAFKRTAKPPPRALCFNANGARGCIFAFAVRAPSPGCQHMSVKIASCHRA